MHEIVSWQGLELVIRSDSVDRAELEWMAASPFWKAFESSAVSPGDVVLDLGAHIGSFAILAAKHKLCRVLAFEPDLESLNICKANILLNGLEDSIVCHKFAVGSESRKLLLYESTENWAHTIVKNGGPYNVLTGKTTEVDCLSLSDALELAECIHCAFLKCNIEGAEYDMIENANVDTLHRIDRMVVEIHPDIGGRSPDRMFSRLADAGFSVDFDADRSMVSVARD